MIFIQDSRPKSVYKNLDEIIRASSTNSRKQSPQTIVSYKNTPKKKSSSDQYSHALQQSKRHSVNNSVSRHSLRSKQKLQVSGLLSNSKSVKSEKQKQKSVKHIKATQKPNINLIQKVKTPVQSKKDFYHQIDAMFTDMQDFLRQSKQNLFQKIEKIDLKSIQNIVESLRIQSQVFKDKINQQIKSMDGKILNILSNNDAKWFVMQKNQKKKSEKLTKTSSNRYFTEQAIGFSQNSSKISQIANNSNNNVGSVNNLQTQVSHYIPTQTEDQLLSLLVYKNKVNSHKRKVNTKEQATQKVDIPMKSRRPLLESNAGLGAQQYSFRSKKRQKLQTKQKQKSLKNKENREKSIYQIVLEEKSQRKKSKHQF